MNISSDSKEDKFSDFSEAMQEGLDSLRLEDIHLDSETLAILKLLDQKEISEEEALKRVLSHVQAQHP